MIQTCQICGKRPALAARGRYSNSHKRGQHFSRADHDTCRQCWSSSRSRNAIKRPRGRLDGVLDDLMAQAGIEIRGAA
jgi:ribosomal protein L28